MADATLTAEAAGDRFGFTVGTAGDVDGDGRADVVIGAYQNDTAAPNAGRVYVCYLDPPPAAARTGFALAGQPTGDCFGCAVGTAGDVNGDGYGDLIVGAPRNDRRRDRRRRAVRLLRGPRRRRRARTSSRSARQADEIRLRGGRGRRRERRRLRRLRRRGARNDYALGGMDAGRACTSTSAGRRCRTDLELSGDGERRPVRLLGGDGRGRERRRLRRRRRRRAAQRRPRARTAAGPTSTTAPRRPRRDGGPDAERRGERRPVRLLGGRRRAT